MLEFVKYTIGAEVEHTPAFSKKTLFVEGLPSSIEVARIALAEKVQHVRFSPRTADHNWDRLLTDVLDLGLWATLEYPAAFHPVFQLELSKGVLQSRRYVPLINVKLHDLAASGTNLSIKFESDTNPGNWTLNCSDLMDSNKYTSWEDYESRVEYDPCPPKAVRPKVDEDPEAVVKLVQEDTEPNQQALADEIAQSSSEEIVIKAADIPADIQNTTSASIDSADADDEPELVARKTVNEALAKQKAQNDAEGKVVKKAK